MSHRLFRAQLLALGLFCAFAAGSASAAVPRTPEQESLWLLAQLRPVADEDWVQIAGQRAAERYSIVAGDTLWDISQRLFGDARYWPKIWAINNDTITNPHLIRPGNFIQFSPGSAGILPSVQIVDATGVSGSTETTGTLLADGGDAAVGPSVIDIDNQRPRSQEWKKLPKQAWEFQAAPPASEFDDTGFDRSSKIRFKKADGFSLPFIVSSDEIEPIGEIVAGRTEAKVFSLRDTAFIQGRGDLQVGEVYTIVGEPLKLKDGFWSSLAFSYLVRGQVKIIGVKDGLFVGEVTRMDDSIERGNFIVPNPARVKDLPPIAGPSPLEAHILLERNFSTYATSQYKFVFIDRGRDDGVREGMVFRAFQKKDPVTKKTITESDFIARSDIQVVQVGDRVSVGYILNGMDILNEGDPVNLLTDVSDVIRKRKAGEKMIDFGSDTPRSDSVEAIDEIEVGGGLGKKEAKELRQLERWDEQGKPIAPEAQPGLDEPGLDELDAEESGSGTAEAPVAPPVEEAPAPEAPAPEDGLNELDALEGDAAPETAPAVNDGASVTEPAAPAEEVVPSEEPAAPAPPSPQASPTPDDEDLDALLDE